MGSTSLRLGDPPSRALRAWRARRGRAQLHKLVDAIVQSTQRSIAGIEFTLRHRPVRDLDAVELALVKHLAHVEDALAHVRRLQRYRDMPVSETEQAGWGGDELVEILKAGVDG